MSAEKSSKTHRLIKNYVLTEQDRTFPNACVVLEKAYSLPGNEQLFKEFCDLRDAYLESDVLLKRLESATKMGDIAVKIRRSIPELTHTVLTTHRSPTIKIGNLTDADVADLTTLWDHVKTKATGITKTGPKDLTEMWTSFTEDLATFKEIGIFDSSWTNGVLPKIARIMSWAAKNAKIVQNFSNFKTPVGVDDTLFKQRIAQMKLASEVPMPTSNTGTVPNMACKFMVDYWITFLAQCFRPFKTPAGIPPINFLLVVPFMERMAIFSRGNHIGKKNLSEFIKIQSTEIQKIFTKVSDENSLLMNPGKLTVSRIFGAIAPIHKTGTAHGLLNISFKEESFALLAKIYRIEKPLSSDKTESSDCEYILHEILTLGIDGGFEFNKNLIPKSFLEVKFELSNN